MESQQPNLDTHNILCAEILQNKQIHYTRIMKLDTHKSMFYEGVERKYITNVVIGGYSHIKLYAIFENNVIQQLGQWQLHTKIDDILQWDKCIVISAQHKIVGLIFEENILKNAFMLSLEFLFLKTFDTPRISADKNGRYLVIYIGRFLLVCLSGKTIQKYRDKTICNRYIQLITQQCKWNRVQDQYIAEIVKIKLIDFDVLDLYSFKVQEEFLYIYLEIRKNRLNVLNLPQINQANTVQNTSQNFASTPAFYFVNLATFYMENKAQIFQLHSEQDQTVIDIIPVINHEFEQTNYIYLKKNKIEVLSKQGRTTIGEWMVSQGSKQLPKIINTEHITDIDNPIGLMRDNKVYLYRKNFRGFESKQIVSQSITAIDLTEQFYVSSTLQEAKLINLTDMTKITLHKSLGRIIDFQIKGGFLVIESNQDNRSRLLKIKKSFQLDRRMFVTHSKKIALETKPGFYGLKSMKIAGVYAMAINKSGNLFWDLIVQTSFLQQSSDNSSQFQIILNECCWVEETNFKTASDKQAENLIVCYKDNSLNLFKITVVNDKLKLEQIKKIDIKIQASSKIFLIENFIIFRIKQTQTVLNIVNLVDSSIKCVQIPMVYEDSCPRQVTSHEQIQMDTEQPKIIKIFIFKRDKTFKKNEKDLIIMDITFCTPQKIQIWELDMQTLDNHLIHRTSEIGQGLPILYNYEEKIMSMEKMEAERPTPLLRHTSSHQHTSKVHNYLRSLTAPQYFVQGVYKSSEQHVKIRDFWIFQTSQHKKYLFLINRAGQLIVYLQIISQDSNLGYIYQRVMLPSFIARKWKYRSQSIGIGSYGNTIRELGCNLLLIGNFIFYEGAWFEGFSEQHYQPQLSVRNLFQMNKDVWIVQTDGKIRMLENKQMTNTELIGNYAITPYPCAIKQQLIGLDATNDFYCIYSRKDFQIFDREMKSLWLYSNVSSSDDHEEIIITIKAFDEYVAVSYYDYYADQKNKDQYQSIKFKLKIYHTMTKIKVCQKDKLSQQPILFIHYLPPDKLLLVGSSNISINIIKSDRTLEPMRSLQFSKRAFLAGFSYIPQIVPLKPGYMLFGGMHGGLSFRVGQWIENGDLRQIYSEPLKFQMRHLELFHYGKELKGFAIDIDGNIIVLDLKSKKTQKIADFNLNTAVNKTYKINDVIYCCSDDGCIRNFIPVKLVDVQVSYLDFQNIIQAQIPFLGGFNQMQYRLLKQKRRTFKLNREGNIVDGRILQEFLSLTKTLQHYILQRAELTNKQFKNNLLSFC